MQSEEQKGDIHEDTGIGLTFTSKQDVSEPDKKTEIPRPEEPIASTGTKVSPFPIASFEEPSFNSNEVEILSSDTDNLEHDGSETRSRTLTSKGREYQRDLKKKAALARDRELRAKLRSFEGFVRDCKSPDEIRMEIAQTARDVDEVQQAFDDWIELSDDTSECQRASNKQSYIYDAWKIAHATAVQEIKRLEEDSKSIYSRKSSRSRTSTKSGSSKSLSRETLIACQAKKAALKEKLKFSPVIAEQESKLEQLRIQKELEEIAAQEAVYKKAIDEENQLDDEQQPLLPTTLHDPIGAFLNYHEEAGLTSTPEAPILTSCT